MYFKKKIMKLNGSLKMQIVKSGSIIHILSLFSTKFLNTNLVFEKAVLAWQPC